MEAVCAVSRGEKIRAIAKKIRAIAKKNKKSQGGHQFALSSRLVDALSPSRFSVSLGQHPRCDLLYRIAHAARGELPRRLGEEARQP